ncbi:unnamed protein product [Protopolystoma xenopodis]|uniref:Uncharacterized protein n=1 Tax=Protopolystoma xenopodis TaxID=117903 RepID=A0A448XHK2_9PLAT|nr:unnamed protein product [Protopolystoma xenopodis]
MNTVAGGHVMLASCFTGSTADQAETGTKSVLFLRFVPAGYLLQQLLSDDIMRSQRSWQRQSVIRASCYAFWVHRSAQGRGKIGFMLQQINNVYLALCPPHNRHSSRVKTE